MPDRDLFFANFPGFSGAGNDGAACALHASEDIARRGWKTALMLKLSRLGYIAALASAAFAVSAHAAAVGDDGAVCNSGSGPAILANIVGLKDRTGLVKLELYPAVEGDFLRDDYLLQQEHKLFRRVTARTPQAGPVQICMRVPGPGRYALLFTHNRDGKSKFDFWNDGAGFPSNEKLGRSRPKLYQATITAGPGITSTTIQAQYLRGLGGFGPMKE